MIPILAFFLLKDAHSLRRGVIEALPHRFRLSALRLFEELNTTAKSISSLNFRDVEMLATVAVTYLAIVWTLSGLIRLLERRLAIPERR